MIADLEGAASRSADAEGPDSADHCVVRISANLDSTHKLMQACTIHTLSHTVRWGVFPSTNSYCNKCTLCFRVCFSSLIIPHHPSDQLKQEELKIPADPTWLSLCCCFQPAAAQQRTAHTPLLLPTRCWCWPQLHWHPNGTARVPRLWNSSRVSASITRPHEGPDSSSGPVRPPTGSHQ